MNLPKGHLSPSQLNQWSRCEQQYSIFSIGGAKSPPDFALETKKLTHEVILEDDLKEKIASGHNRANSELLEIHRAKIEERVLPLAREDPNLEMPAPKAVEEETKYFAEIVRESESFRRETVPLEVEKPLAFTIGDVPISCRLDLVADETISKRVEDLKRQGQTPPAGSASYNRQLVTYAMGTGIPDVGLAVIVENKRPKVVREPGQVTPGEIERVTRQYQAAAFQIENAMQSGIFSPVDHGDKAKAWVCSAKFCGAWRIGSKDWLTGRDITCPYGERSSVSVGGGK